MKVKIKSLGNLKILLKIQGDWDNLDYGIDGEEFGVLITQDLGQHVMDKVLNQAKKQAVEVLESLVKTFNPFIIGINDLFDENGNKSSFNKAFVEKSLKV